MDFYFPNLADWVPSSFRGDSPARRDLIEGRLPRGKLVLLAGEGGVGKSMLMLDLFEAVTRGGKEAFGGRVIGAPQPCILLTGEDDRASIDLRLKVIRQGEPGADFGAILPCPDIGLLTLARTDYVNVVESTDTLDWLEEQLKMMSIVHGPLGFLAIDPWALFFPVDTNSAEHVQAVWGRLSGLATRLDCTVIVVHHMGKGNGDSRTRVRGSTALIDGVRAAYALELVPADEAARIRADLDVDEPLDVVRLALLKNNLGLRRSHVTYLRLPDGRLQDVSALLQPAKSPEEALLLAIRDAAHRGERLTKTGGNGVYEAKKNREWWPRELSSLSKRSVETLVNTLIARGRVRICDGALATVD